MVKVNQMMWRKGHMGMFRYGTKLVAALSDKTRVELVRILSCGEQPLTILERELGLPRETIEGHLALLLNVRLVTSRVDETSVLWGLTPDAKQTIDGFLENRKTPSDAVFCAPLRNRAGIARDG